MGLFNWFFNTLDSLMQPAAGRSQHSRHSHGERFVDHDDYIRRNTGTSQDL